MKMKSRIIMLTALTAMIIGMGVVIGNRTSAKSAPAAMSPVVCTPTGFIRDSINLTAAKINPSSVTGVVNATGCNIGVYYGPGSKGTIKNAEIYGANYFGVLANGDAGDVTLDILSSNIHNIGETPLNGSQHGVAIYWRAFFAEGSVSGRVVGNTITGYQKGGIVANGPGTQAIISDNTVTGSGHVLFIAMNGIQVGYGASGSVMRNRVSGNSYIGYPGDGSASGGIIVVGGAGYGTCPDGNDCAYTVNTKINDNVLTGNDVGVYLSNLAADYSAPVTATNVKAVNNTITDNECFNSSYQAGISDVGNNDKMINNTISGAGYQAPCGFAIDADLSFTNRPKIHANR